MVENNLTCDKMGQHNNCVKNAVVELEATSAEENIKRNISLDSNRQEDKDPLDGDDTDAELTELEKQIVAKYLSELAASSEDNLETDNSESNNCDLNNNCNEETREKEDDGQEKVDKIKCDCDSKNADKCCFPMSMPREELVAVTMLLQQFPQLAGGRRTSLDSSSTGDSVEDLVSACPQLVHFLANATTAAATATANYSCSAHSASHLLLDQKSPSYSAAGPATKATTTTTADQLESDVKQASNCNSTSSSTSSAAIATVTTTNAVNVGSFCNSAINSKVTNERRDKKVIKKRPNYAVWMGVSSCIWGLLFYLVKNYL